MSVPLINRSLTTIRTELEFLKDSEVINDALYEKLMQAIPAKYQKDMPAWGPEKLLSSDSNQPALNGRSDSSLNASSTTAATGHTLTDKLTNDFAAASISSHSQSQSIPPPNGPPPSKTLGYCRAIYDYKSQEPDDLEFSKGAKIEILEHLSEDWWRGTTNGKTGVFPSNYCVSISIEEFEDANSGANEKPIPNEKHQYAAPPPNYGQANYGPPSLQPQTSYGGYAQYPPPSTNYYQQPPPQQAPPQQAPPQEQPQQEQHHHHMSGGFKKFGSKLGNAAIFGAGATIGSDIVNSIF